MIDPISNKMDIRMSVKLATRDHLTTNLALDNKFNEKTLDIDEESDTVN